MIVLPQPAEAAALTGRHSAGDEIGSTRGFRADRSAEGTESETDGSTGCRFGLKSASASWRARCSAVCLARAFTLETQAAKQIGLGFAARFIKTRLRGDELGCGLQDPLARRASLRRCGYVRVRHDRMVADLDLTVQL